MLRVTAAFWVIAFWVIALRITAVSLAAFRLNGTESTSCTKRWSKNKREVLSIVTVSSDERKFRKDYDDVK